MPTPYVHDAPDPDFDPAKAYPPAAIRAEFARRLQAAMLDRGWNQSDLARASGVSRANVSVYVRAKSTPMAPHLAALASALGMKPGDLLPAVRQATEARLGTRRRRDARAPSIYLLSMPGGGTSWLHLECELPTPVAVRILAEVQAALGGPELPRLRGKAAPAEDDGGAE